ncbi:hypothetical protein SLEP1_g306 [Rubroshorea leprosula]|uniref:Uncharacterized protein n=1 Tax=Rubroshorea leprosula TaxID=152421 RepID=A0AAV5HJF5_9ROSI|nr:hypothetical protein SLEP1_g306 [Rubroshorea leprosula]
MHQLQRITIRVLFKIDTQSEATAALETLLTQGSPRILLIAMLIFQKRRIQG